ncbi:Major facilitator superfamily protein [Mycena chlorophos]|uniref:Major facilitator superfamily protein n=1 Tax=Mycena chlorophos TaxID=658473 RepID=A0A8H6VZG9_MYCCL|nr:Major facilitator superfamily protein [Mycena chlorophos]
MSDLGERHSDVRGEAIASRDRKHSFPMADGGSEPDLSTPRPANEIGANVNEGTVLTGSRLALVFIALLLSALPVALDQSILATALPRIASDFDSFTLQGWVATAFVLAQTVFLLFFGQLLRVFPAKHILLATIAISGGRSRGSVRRACISNISGPLIGGALTDDITWRWCFWLSLPFGGVSMFFVALLLKAAPPLGSDPVQRTWASMGRQVLHLDYLGATLVAASATTLILALQWGGNTKPWNSGAVIACLVLAFVFGIATILWEMQLGEAAMVPTSIFKSRSIYAIIFYSMLSRFAMLLLTYYIPIFYQAARHRTATQSGIDLLPFMMATVISIIGSGWLVSFLQRYHPLLLAGAVISTIGSALLYTVSPSTSSAALVGYQILAGVGIGLGWQNTLVAMQVEFRAKGELKLIGQASSMASFAQFLGGTLGLGIAEPVFASELSRFLAKYAPDAPAAVVEDSPTAIYTALPEALIPGVVKSYTEALRIVFLLTVPIGTLAFGAGLLIQNLKITKVQPAAAPTAAASRAVSVDLERAESIELPTRKKNASAPI